MKLLKSILVNHVDFLDTRRNYVLMDGHEWKQQGSLILQALGQLHLRYGRSERSSASKRGQLSKCVFDVFKHVVASSLQKANALKWYREKPSLCIMAHTGYAFEANNNRMVSTFIQAQLILVHE